MASVVANPPKRVPEGILLVRLVTTLNDHLWCDTISRI